LAPPERYRSRLLTRLLLLPSRLRKQELEE
jgi:hypothetical protein